MILDQRIDNISEKYSYQLILINIFQKISTISDSCVPTYYSDDDTSGDESEIEEPRLHLYSINA
ncbi:hypothetical protein BpHYR1_014975 [Brachionus plicatilis]|uniref:Uncharacterized protein n=1 Tax=Brachionus plicatilis TaxID=10195 RepID=A0A3M7QRH3_BRAPC|nr:hypothetical protein BpHYR1_014975 [Brachionus plicatilis]